MMSGLVNYDESSSDEDEVPTTVIASSSATAAVITAPTVAAKPGRTLVYHVSPQATEVAYNPKADQLYAPEVGPMNKGAQRNSGLKRNTYTGHIEEGHINSYQFDNQQHSFNNLGFAMDPAASDRSYIGDMNAMKKHKGMSNMQVNNRKNKKKKRKPKGSADDIHSYLGPWADFENETRTAAPSEEQMKILDEWDKQKNGDTEVVVEDGKKVKRIKETSTLHIDDAIDYQGRSFLHPPQTEDVNFDKEIERCYIPKKHIHSWAGHKNGTTAIRLFPHSGHLLLSCGNDKLIKLWEVYGKRRLIRTYKGHTEAVRDLAFNHDGSQFVSCGFDKVARLWDTESGECLGRFTNHSVIYCVKFHPSPEKQNLFVMGTQNKHVLCYDTETGEVVQDYDRHLGAVNSITFVEEGRKMVTTSDDKTIRIWEWDIPVDVKVISDPSMHSMPRVTLHPNTNYFIAQRMDNKIATYSCRDRFTEQRKTFRGHNVAGYACNIGFSPDGLYVISGDSTGNLCLWDWKTTRLINRIKAHDKTCIDVQWMPHETSKVVTASWDGSIKLWD